MCALPKGFIKNLRISPQKEGPERRQEILNDINNKGDFLPAGVGVIDMDIAFQKFVKENLELTIEGVKVPVILLSIQRWAEFSKTWEFTDEFKNIKLPFISIVRQPDIQVGTNQVGLWNIPSHRTYTYVKVPIFEGGRKGVDLYQIPQPTAVNVNYEVRLFCDMLQDVDKFSEIVQTTWNARQAYLNVKGHPMPLIMEGNSDESPIEDFENRRFYINLTEITLEGYILNEDDYKIIPTVDRGVIMTEINLKTIKPKFNVSSLNGSFNYDFLFSCTDDTSINFTITNEISINSIVNLVNTVNPLFTLNGNPINLPFNVGTGDNINITITRNIGEDSAFNLIGKTNE